MTETSGSMPPGWYFAQGDPPGTLRWWDGHQWQGGPVLAGGYPGYGAPSRDALPQLGRVLAGPWHRIAAALIDTLITMVISIPVLILTTDFDDFRDTNYFEVNLTIWPILTSAALVFAEIAFIALKGATPGKLALGIEVIGQDGTSPPGWRKAALRNVLVLLGFVPVVSLVASVLGFASLILLFADDRRRTIEDRIASTYVVRSR